MSGILSVGGAGNVGASGSFYSYSIDQSLRFDRAGSAHLNFTPASAGNQKTWTWSAWIKRSTLGVYQNIFNPSRGGDGANESQMAFQAGDGFQIYDSGATRGNKVTTRKFRDTSSWYHIVVALDTTDATAEDRVKIYVNGERETLFSTNSNPALNTDWGWNAAREHALGSYNYGADSQFFGGYMAEVNFIDGTALDATSFGETINGIWVPKNVSGLTYGTNGFYLSFADSAAIGDDLSGNTNDFTANNLAASDVVPDSPTNNFATWNVTGVQYGGTNAPTVSEGSLKAASSGNPTHTYGTFAIQPTDTQGYYWEVKAISIDVDRSYLGIVAPEGDASGASIGSYQFYYKFVLNRNGSLYGNNDVSAVNVVALTSWTNNDILMFAYKDGKFWIGKNGTWMNSGDPAAGTGDLVAQDGGRPSDRGDVTWYPYAGFNSTYTANFGQEGTFAGTETAGGNSDENGYGDFKYAVPSGFLAMCSANLPEPEIGPNSSTTSDQHFSTVLYTGTNPTSQSVTGVGFQPDFVWWKNRTDAAQHMLGDSVRGAGKVLSSNSTNAELDSTSTYFSSFDSDGFTVTASNVTNGTSDAIVAWNWKAGGTAVSNTDGSITSSVSVNDTALFSIGTYTGNGTVGATVGHGLGVAPNFLIIKNRSTAQSWPVKVVPPFAGGTRMQLESTAATTTESAGAGSLYNATNPSSSVITLGDQAMTNTSSNNYVFYAFANVDGYCKSGSYVGNGSTDGTFVYTGFRPAWVMYKTADTTANNWAIRDNKRDPDNEVLLALYANLTNADDTGGDAIAIDFLSNGFKARRTNSQLNQSGTKYIYLAFAEAPFKYANAR
jgi:hypothetical protein